MAVLLLAPPAARRQTGARARRAQYYGVIAVGFNVAPAPPSPPANDFAVAGCFANPTINLVSETTWHRCDIIRRQCQAAAQAAARHAAPRSSSLLQNHRFRLLIVPGGGG